MKFSDVDEKLILATLKKVGSEFHTRDLSEHPDMIAGQPNKDDRNYHSMIGRFLARHVNCVESMNDFDRMKGERWRNHYPEKAKPTNQKNRLLDARQGQRIIRNGHWKALENLQDGKAYRETRELYREELGGIDVFLCPAEKGLTVVSLDFENCPSRIGVGADNTNQCTLNKIPPDPKTVRHAVKGYETKRASMMRASGEERHGLRLIADALSNGLVLGPGHVVTMEWRLPSRQRVDLLCANPKQECLVVIELKQSEAMARKVERKKGGNAWDQAQNYADEIYEHRQELYPFFEQLGRTLAQNHSAVTDLRNLNLDINTRPRALVSWPGGGFPDKP